MLRSWWKGETSVPLRPKLFPPTPKERPKGTVYGIFRAWRATMTSYIA